MLICIIPRTLAAVLSAGENRGMFDWKRAYHIGERLEAGSVSAALLVAACM